MIIDTTTFRLVPGTDEATFLAADERVLREVVYRQPGLVRRTTARGADGAWLVVTIWQDHGTADAAAQILESAEASALLSAVVDHSSVVAQRWETLD